MAPSRLPTPDQDPRARGLRTRLPTAPRAGQSHNRHNPGRSQALPLLPLLSAVLLIVALGQIGLWALKDRTGRDTSAARQATGAVPGTYGAGGTGGAAFARLLERHPALETRQLRALTPRRVIFPALPENLQFGRPNAAITLTVLSDPACGVCRDSLKTWLEGLPQDIRLVYKFWPADPARMTPGLTLEMARRADRVTPLWALFDTAKGDLDDHRLLALLDQAGLPLEQQRALLTDPSGTLALPLEQDIARARELALPPPPLLLLDGYVLDGRVLQPQRVLTYLERLRSGAALVQPSDTWLMQK